MDRRSHEAEGNSPESAAAAVSCQCPTLTAAAGQVRRWGRGSGQGPHCILYDSCLQTSVSIRTSGRASENSVLGPRPEFPPQ